MATTSCLRTPPQITSDRHGNFVLPSSDGASMPWHNVAYFFGGIFLANFFPHFIAGMSGARFPTPFAKPAFRGPSSPVVNIFYALFNLGMAYTLLVIVGSLELGHLPHVAISAAGFALWSLQIARSVT